MSNHKINECRKQLFYVKACSTYDCGLR